ncbi:hypothetical protein JL722_3386 [Aureococcus anophagefferens]|nr:hypothetical protein JL722_3386 [Aureococcus anophagefferens]
MEAPDGAAQAPLRADAKAATKPASGRSAAAVGVATFVLVAVARSGATLGATASALARRGASDDDAMGAARRGAGRRGDRAATRGLDDDITNPFNLSGTPASNVSASGLPSNFSMTMDDDLTSLERCASYDDDATYTRGSCASCDHAACFLYCTGYCDSMCGDACGGNVSSGAMCALDTLNNLESVCEDGGFCDATSSAAPPTTASVAASSCTGCDSHALCSQCVSGDEGALCMHLMDIDVLTSACKAMILISDMNATCAAYACKNQTSRSSGRASALLAPGALPAR